MNHLSYETFNNVPGLSTVNFYVLAEDVWSYLISGQVSDIESGVTQQDETAYNQIPVISDIKDTQHAMLVQSGKRQRTFFCTSYQLQLKARNMERRNPD